VRSFSETKILRASGQLLGAISSWDRFSLDEQALLVRRYVKQCYAVEGVYLGSRLLVDKEPLPPEGDAPFLSAVETVFPSVRIVVVVRNPEAVVNSMRQRKWGYSVDGMDPQSRSMEECINHWNHGATLAARVASRENTSMVQFEDLVSKPEEESSRVSEFLRLSRARDFTPRQTSEITLSVDECERVWSSTQEARRKLKEHGVVYKQSAYSAHI
jgi:hypothetical protein